MQMPAVDAGEREHEEEERPGEREGGGGRAGPGPADDERRREHGAVRGNGKVRPDPRAARGPRKSMRVDGRELDVRRVVSGRLTHARSPRDGAAETACLEASDGAVPDTAAL